MQYYFAPMEGITGFRYRNLHHRLFPGVDQYYMPFLSPTMHHALTGREWRDALPENNEDTPVVPQILTKNASDFLWAAGELARMGYSQVNLNLGCPSGTVVSKGKGSGMLSNLEGMRAFLAEIFAGCPLPISIKTRVGRNDPEEFGAILEVFNAFPVYELTVHPRIQQDFYKKPVRPEKFAQAVAESKAPLCYNGDLKSGADCLAVGAAYPNLSGVMLGRGLIGNPALVTELKTGREVPLSTLEEFTETLFELYRRDFGSDKNAIFRMKECWKHLIVNFAQSEKLEKALRKANDSASFRELTKRVFRELEWKPQRGLSEGIAIDKTGCKPV